MIGGPGYELPEIRVLHDPRDGMIRFALDPAAARYLADVMAREGCRTGDRAAHHIAHAVDAVLNRPPGPEKFGARTTVDVEDSLRRKQTPEELHARRMHPSFEYATTTGQRKAWDDVDTPPEGEGWVRNVDAGRNGWDRFDYTEESYWRRPKQTPVLHTTTPYEPGNMEGVWGVDGH